MVQRINPFALGYEHYKGQPTGRGLPHEVPGTWVAPGRARLQFWSPVFDQMISSFKTSTQDAINNLIVTTTPTTVPTTVNPLAPTIASNELGVTGVTQQTVVRYNDRPPQWTGGRPYSVTSQVVANAESNRFPAYVPESAKSQYASWTNLVPGDVDNTGNVLRAKRRLQELGFLSDPRMNDTMTWEFHEALRQFQMRAPAGEGFVPRGTLDFFTYYRINQEAYHASQNRTRSIVPNGPIVNQIPGISTPVVDHQTGVGQPSLSGTTADKLAEAYSPGTTPQGLASRETKIDTKVPTQPARPGEMETHRAGVNIQDWMLPIAGLLLALGAFHLVTQR